MLFDWFTVVAQIANFLILMWLLKRFLYQPILHAIDAREKRIADLLQETELSQQQMEQQRAELATKNKAFASEREILLVQAKSEAESTKQKMLALASEEVSQQRHQWIANLLKEQINLEHDISNRTKQEVFHVARKALADLSDIELEAQITRVFIKQLQQLGPQQRQQFSMNTQGELTIRTAMPLSDHNKNALTDAIMEAFSTQLPIRFECVPELISGIEMVGNGHKLSWNIDDYLSNLEASIGNIVNSKTSQSLRQPTQGATGATNG